MVVTRERLKLQPSMSGHWRHVTYLTMGVSMTLGNIPGTVLSRARPYCTSRQQDMVTRSKGHRVVCETRLFPSRHVALILGRKHTRLERRPLAKPANGGRRCPVKGRLAWPGSTWILISPVDVHNCRTSPDPPLCRVHASEGK